MRQFLMAMVFAAAPSAVLAEDGMFADFTTSLGEFSVELDFVETPRTVANFVSLAEGSRRWVDPLTGAVMGGARYYDGVIFHRVIAGFMSQSGSRNGQGTDGPGYRFRDEISPNLPHDRHVISMANSGPNSNGAQFFITDEPTPNLNGKHAVFGRVVAGGDVVDAINAVPTLDERPLAPVVIESVRIRRVGAAAGGFDVMAWDLPVVSALPGRLEVTPGGPIRYHVVPDEGRTMVQGHYSLDLDTWTSFLKRNEDRTDIDPAVIQIGTASLPRLFFHFSQVFYPDALPSSMANAVLDVEYSGTERLVFTVNADGQTGVCEYTSASGTISHPISQVVVYPDDVKAEYLFNVVGLGWRGFAAAVRETEPGDFRGVADVYHRDQLGWFLVDSGTFTLTQ